MSTDLTSPALEGVVVDPPRAQTIFGREPAAWVGLIEAVLGVLLAFALGISQETFGPIMAVVSAAAGIYTAWATRDTMLGVIVGLVKALVTLVAVYGLTLTDQQVGAVLAVTAVVVAFVQRDRTSPIADLALNSEDLPPAIPDAAAMGDGLGEGVGSLADTIYSSDAKTDAAGYDPKGA